MATVERGSRPDRRSAPRQVAVAADGSRVVFLRAGQLWTYELATGAERLVAAPPGPGITGYATDAAARLAAFPVRGQLFRADLCTGAVGAVPTAGPANDPRPDPTGQRIGYLSGAALHLAHSDGVLAGEPDPAQGGHPYVTWGRPDPTAARHFGRDRGWWWAPDGRSVLAARVDQAHQIGRAHV